MRFLLLCFIVIPVVEMWLLIEVGGFIGAGPTILLVLLTAVIGSMLLRTQGLSTLLRARQRLESNQLPANEMVEGLLLAVSGALLLTPGFVTDAVGFVGLLPFTRIPLVSWLVKKFKVSSLAAMNQGAGGNVGKGAGKSTEGETIFQQSTFHYQRGSSEKRPDDGSIDAEFWEEPDSDSKDNKNNNRIE